jgi:cephalosporin-C deacetylase
MVDTGVLLRHLVSRKAAFPRLYTMDIQHDFPFDPRYGYNLQQLLAVGVPQTPVDFVPFWTDTYKRARQIPLNIAMREVASENPAFRLHEVEYDSWDGLRIGGWIMTPADGIVESATVIGHGYGGRDGPSYDAPLSRAAVIFPCARGMNRSAHPEFPSDAQQHVLHGIESRERYSHLGCVVDYWLAASVILGLYPQAAERLDYQGGSFGGGIGALLLPWDNRFRRACLDIPSFGNHPLRMTLPCVGSGQAAQQIFHGGHPEILDVLKYFDAAIAAQFIRIPVFAALAMFDPCVPPPGQFAIYNALPGEKELFLRQAAHFDLAGNEHDDAAIHARLRRWFA